MINYIKIELEKFDLTKYIYGAIICNIGAIALLILFDLVLNTQSFSEQTYATLFAGISDITKELYIIFTAVMIGKIIVKEYREGTVKVLFTYPISRTKLIGSKVLLIMGFVSIVVAISTVVNILIVFAIGSLTDLVTAPLELKDVQFAATQVLINASLCSLLGMIPLAIAIKRKSESLMIFLAFVIISVDEVIVLSQLMILASFGIVSIILSLFRINKIDLKA